MSRTWIKEVPLAKLEAEKEYFIALRWESNDRKNYSFYSIGLKGKYTWSGKPGIAIRSAGTEGFKKDMRKNIRKFAGRNQTIVLLEVPHDADKRWTARKPVSRGQKRRPE